ncbi:4906_t:CDS:2 [Funneliformis mosseae]|uniref:4906_t:CDS:1 n=1 Tax=Funneliformis mosseae TaxID=27381 RepID=A0A9N9CNL8_FUNMO|nr:4906_t:CDS:2 [Funneliformis mosseae]
MHWAILQKFNLKENRAVVQKLLDTKHKILIEDIKGQANSYRNAYFAEKIVEEIQVIEKAATEKIKQQIGE